MRGKGSGLGGWVSLVAGLIACVGLGYAAYALAGVSWDAVVSYRSPYAEVKLPETRAGSAVASRTVLVIVDGLRQDAAAKMGTFSALRSHGASMTLIAPQPSLSFPNWTTILTGAPPFVSGVTTNWHEGQAPVESIFDTAKRAGATVVFSGPEDFEQLFGVREKTAGSFMKKWDNEYLSAEYVDAALSLAEKHHPGLIVVHLPDVDETGHASGGASGEYAATAASVDADLGRLVTGLQDGNTAFVVVADHGHIDTGGHGGWEPEVVRVPLAMAGPGVDLATGSGHLESIAPSVAYLSGIPVPRYAVRPALDGAVGRAAQTDPRMKDQLSVADAAFAAIVSSDSPSADKTNDFELAQDERLARDRQRRLWLGLAGGIASVLVLVIIALASKRALIAALSGTAAYYTLYNLMFFVVHGNQWSLSAFNSEDLVKSWMNTRLVEAAISLLVAAAVAAIVYPRVGGRKATSGPHVSGWLALGPATSLAVLATLGLQIAWFAWWWGAIPVWRLPDLMWGFKYDLDLIQATAVGFAAVVAPVVTYLVGRVLPRQGTAGGDRSDDGPAAGAPVPQEPLTPVGAGSISAEE